MRTLIHLGEKPVTLNFKGFEEEVDIDRLLEINHSNIYGEAVTIPVLLNTAGILRAESESVVSEKKLELDIFEAELKQRFRKEAVVTGQKTTEASLDEMTLQDPGFQIKSRNLILAQKNHAIVESLWWGAKSKDTKLNNLIKSVTPAELYNELIEETVNNILIKKHRSITDPQ